MVQAWSSFQSLRFLFNFAPPQVSHHGKIVIVVELDQVRLSVFSSLYDFGKVRLYNSTLMVLEINFLSDEGSMSSVV